MTHDDHDDLTVAYMKGYQDGKDAAEGLDAMLDSMAPNDDCKPRITVMDEAVDGGWYVEAWDDWASTYEGTGPTRMAAIRDAVQKAREASQ